MPSTNNVSNLSNQELVAAKKACSKVDSVILKIAGKTITFDSIEAFIRKGSNGVVFVTLPTLHAVAQNGKPLTDPAAVKAALRSFKQKPKPMARPTVEIPEELRKQLEAFSKVNNARVVADAQGNYKVQKVRGRRK